MDKVLFKLLRARSLCVIFETVAIAFLGGVGGFFGGGIGDMVVGAIIGAIIGGFVGIVLVIRYAPEPKAQEGSVRQITDERLKGEPVVCLEV